MDGAMINLLSKGLDGSYQRQQAINNNMANVNTPGYKRKDVDFMETLKAEFDQSDSKNKKSLSLNETSNNHKSRIKDKYPFQFKVKGNTSYKNDENNVDIDTEMVESTKNNLYYNTLVNQLNSRMNILRNVIEKGGN